MTHGKIKSRCYVVKEISAAECLPYDFSCCCQRRAQKSALILHKELPCKHHFARYGAFQDVVCRGTARPVISPEQFIAAESGQKDRHIFFARTLRNAPVAVCGDISDRV